MNEQFLCNLANKIDPSANLKPNAKARPGTFFAKDNIKKFVEFCVKIGVPAPQQFDVPDLNDMKNPTSVLNCLLNVAFIATSKYQVEPPPSVEKEFYEAQSNK